MFVMHISIGGEFNMNSTKFSTLMSFSTNHIGLIYSDT